MLREMVAGICTTICALGAAACGSDGGDGADASSASASTGPGAGGASSAGSGTSTGTGVGASGGASTGAGGSGAAPVNTRYQGFGAITLGHASCPDTPAEVHVTSLADGGPGSLREAFAGGCRHIVFDVAGTIALESDLNLPHSYVTVDGSTAPAPGITIEQSNTISTTIEASGSLGPAHDIIVRYLRMDGQATEHLDEGDIWGLDGEAAPVYAIIIDHVTGIASADGVFDLWGDVKDVTISRNLVIDTVAALHLSTGDLGQSRERVSFHENVFARNNERQIRLRHNSNVIDYVNNVVYGWGWMEGGAAGLHIAYDAGETNPSMNVVGNVFHFVPGLSGGADDAIRFERGADEGSVFFDGNVVPAGEADVESSGPALPIPAEAQVTLLPTASLASDVVPAAGTHHPTAEETELLAQIAQDIQ